MTTFSKALEYNLPDITGKHHNLFVDPAYAQAAAYQDFWRRLARGEPFTDRFERRYKSGRKIWIQATYARVTGLDGKIATVIKIASDVTRRVAAFNHIDLALQVLRDGDLTRRPPHFDLADFDRIGAVYNHAMVHLADTLRHVAQVAQQVQTISQDMDHAASQLSTRTTSQAARLEQTAATLEELTSTVRSSTDSVRDAEHLASDTVASARNSDAVVKRAIDAMAQIKTSSNKISQIIAVIDDIAFQTNLLALTAGVEAARAGDAGRGFAVVASGVRGLTHRAQEAAGEIKALIGRSAGHVARGVDLVNETGDELRNIIASIGTISGTMGQIAVVARQQSVTLDQINSGVGHLDSVTQKNAGMVDQMSHANATLMANVAEMIGQVAQFDGAATRPAPVRRAG